MYDITGLVYGFNFSDEQYPDIGITINKEMLEWVTDSSLFESPYTGHCENPCYLGFRIADDDNNLSMFELVASFESDLNSNSSKYDTEIKNKISQIIEDIIAYKDEIVNDESEEEDYNNIIKYFTVLLNTPPQKFNIRTTS